MASTLVDWNHMMTPENNPGLNAVYQLQPTHLQEPCQVNPCTRTEHHQVDSWNVTDQLNFQECVGQYMAMHQPTADCHEPWDNYQAVHCSWQAISTVVTGARPETAVHVQHMVFMQQQQHQQHQQKQIQPLHSPSHNVPCMENHMAAVTVTETPPPRQVEALDGATSRDMLDRYTDESVTSGTQDGFDLLRQELTPPVSALRFDSFIEPSIEEASSKVACHWQNPNGLCSRFFDDLAQLTEHIEHDHIGHRKSEYICCWDGCHREREKFKQRQKISRHMKVHTGYKPFPCLQCGFCFGEKTSLKQHQLIHANQKPLICPECHRAFRVATALSVHKRIHSGERPFVCKECGKDFCESSNFNKHKKTHRKVKPYACSACDLRFARPDARRRHWRKAHPELLFARA